jgi:hypothetical protein
MNESQFQKTNGEVAAKFNLGKKVVLILCWRLGVLQNLNCCEISEGTKTVIVPFPARNRGQKHQH